MKTIAKIIQMFGGYKNLSVSIHNEPYMRLAIEHIGTGPRGYQAISVAHYFEQNGDLCQDPELCFELVPQGAHFVYEPYLFQQAIPPIYQEVYERGENLQLKRQLSTFADTWDRNLEAQGFLAAGWRKPSTSYANHFCLLLRLSLWSAHRDPYASACLPHLWPPH